MSSTIEINLADDCGFDLREAPDDVAAFVADVAGPLVGELLEVYSPAML